MVLHESPWMCTFGYSLFLDKLSDKFVCCCVHYNINFDVHFSVTISCTNRCGRGHMEASYSSLAKRETRR